MITKNAVAKVLKEEDISKYRMAKDLDKQPIMIDNYLKGTRMGVKTAEKFLTLYGVEISDAYTNRKVINEAETSSDSSS